MRTVLTGLTLLLFASMLHAACSGAVPITVLELMNIIGNQLGLTSSVSIDEQKDLVFHIIRLPRIILGVLVGASLSIAGASLQGLFRNPVADAGLIGVTSGASLFAMIIIMLNVKFLGIINEYAGAYTISFASFIGAALTTLLVYQLSKRNGKGDTTTILLFGLAINAMVGAITGLMTYLADDDQLRSITFWNLGSLGGASWISVSAVLPFVLISFLLIPYLSKSLNLLVLGESQAAALGVNLVQLKRQIIILATMGVGASVAVTGTIGFIGLVVPHIIRSAFGPDHKMLLPGSALVGAIVLTFADTLSRTIVAPAELPIGIITAMLGAPFFLYILWKQNRKRI